MESQPTDTEPREVPEPCCFTVENLKLTRKPEANAHGCVFILTGQTHGGPIELRFAMIDAVFLRARLSAAIKEYGPKGGVA